MIYRPGHPCLGVPRPWPKQAPTPRGDRTPRRCLPRILCPTQAACQQTFPLLQSRRRCLSKVAAAFIGPYRYRREATPLLLIHQSLPG